MITDTPKFALASSAENILNSWKEIATYLDRGVRTVQRWEADLGLPVRRPRGKSRSAVIAVRSDLDEWLKSCPLHVRENSSLLSNGNGSDGAASPLNSIRANGASPSALVTRCRGLRLEMELNKAEFRQALRNLINNLDQNFRQSPSEPEKKSSKLIA